MDDTKHEIARENSEVITTNNRYGQRLCLEAWHIMSIVLIVFTIVLIVRTIVFIAFAIVFIVRTIVFHSLYYSLNSHDYSLS